MRCQRELKTHWKLQGTKRPGAESLREAKLWWEEGWSQWQGEDNCTQKIIFPNQNFFRGKGYTWKQKYVGRWESEMVELFSLWIVYNTLKKKVNLPFLYTWVISVFNLICVCIYIWLEPLQRTLWKIRSSLIKCHICVYVKLYVLNFNMFIDFLKLIHSCFRTLN